MVQPWATTGLMRNNPVQGRWELTMTQAGDNYLILLSGGENEIMYIKNFAQRLIQTQ